MALDELIRKLFEKISLILHFFLRTDTNKSIDCDSQTVKPSFNSKGIQTDISDFKECKTVVKQAQTQTVNLSLKSTKGIQTEKSTDFGYNAQQTASVESVHSSQAIPNLEIKDSPTSSTSGQGKKKKKKRKRQNKQNSDPQNESPPKKSCISGTDNLTVKADSNSVKNVSDEDITVEESQSGSFEDNFPADDNENQETKGIYRYSRDLITLVGVTIPDYENVGPVLPLNNNGRCKFDTTDVWKLEENVLWSKIVSGCSDYTLRSKFILLPDQCGGLLIRVKICPLLADQVVEIKLFAEDTFHNEIVPLPQQVGVQMKLRQMTGEKFLSDIHLFVIDRLDRNIVPQSTSLLIPLDDVNMTELPSMTLMFYTVQ